MKVELLNVFGDDLMVSNAARVSYGKTKDKLDEKDAKLIKFLADHKHTSPFRHPQLQFRIQCPIFVERQLFKHQVGFTANSISGRYVDFSDKYYHIETFRKQSKSSKQGSDGVLDSEANAKAQEIYSMVVDVASNAYKALLELGVSKEQARGILPLTLETEFIWTCSLHGFINLCNLRIKPDVQKETCELVTEMLKQVRATDKFTYSLQALQNV
jgi:thymidylate synthase (FAD)